MYNPYLERIGITCFRQNNKSGNKPSPTCYMFTDRVALQMIVSESVYQEHIELLSKLLKAGRLIFDPGLFFQYPESSHGFNIAVRMFLGVDEAEKWCKIPVKTPGWLLDNQHDARVLVLDAPADLVNSITCKKRTWRWLQEAMALSDKSVEQSL